MCCSGPIYSKLLSLKNMKFSYGRSVAYKTYMYLYAMSQQNLPCIYPPPPPHTHTKKRSKVRLDDHCRSYNYNCSRQPCLMLVVL